MSEPNSNRISSKMFQENFKLCLSQIPIAYHRNCSKAFSNYLCQIPIASPRNYSKTFSNDVYANFQFHLIENILTHFQIMSLPISNCISAKLFWHFQITSLPESNAPHPNYSRTFLDCVFGNIPLSLLTWFIFLPLESKQCPLTLPLVLACANSADELLFWNKSES